MKSLTLYLLALSCLPLGANAQPWADARVASEGKYHPRHEFISFNTRETAIKADPKGSPYYHLFDGTWDIEKGIAENPMPRSGELTPPSLPRQITISKYRSLVDIPILWLDRDIFLHIDRAEGAYAVFINDKKAGYSADSRTPSEFLISPYVTDGLNLVRIEVYSHSAAGTWMETLLRDDATPLNNVYLYSQPKVRIDDIVVTARYDEAGKNGILRAEVITVNGYKTDEQLELWWDIYLPNGNRHNTFLKRVTLPAEGADTAQFMEWVYPSQQQRWSPESPALYQLVFFIKRGGRNIEYTAMKVGFNETTLQNGELYINRQPAKLNAVNYTAPDNEAAARKELAALKKRKINTLCLTYPHPGWFYRMCDELGFYVIDQANNNSGFRTSDRRVGGNTANNPDYLSSFIDRVSYMQGRMKNSPSVIATSLGGESGNGHNLYMAYRHLKSVDTLRMTTYRDVMGEWNSDFPFPKIIE